MLYVKHSSMLISFLLSFFLFGLVASTPLPHHQQNEKREFDCQDTSPAAVFDSSCWDQLKLGEFITNWRVELCPPESTGKNCSLPNEPWSTTFLRLAKGQAGYDCSSISLGSCHYDADLDPELDVKIKPMVRYVAYTIFTLNAFWIDWFTALQFAISQASLIIDPLVTRLNPIKTQKFGIEELLTALSAGFAFFGTPALGGTVASAAGSAFTVGVQQAPGVGKAVWPAGTTDSQLVQMSEISSQLGMQVKAIGDRLDAGLHELMYNQESFAKFASSGAWSSQTKLSIPQNTKEITIGLTTFLTSLALTGNKFVGEIFPLHNPRIDITGVCAEKDYKGCYIDGTLGGGVEFILSDTKNNRNRDRFGASRQVMSDIIDAGWTTPQLLFGGAFACAAAGHFNSNVVNVGDDGKIDLSCASRLDECALSDKVDAWNLEYWKQDYPCITDKVNGGCPIRNCVPDATE